MKEFKILKLVDKFKFLYDKCGIDYEKFRLILNVKLTMDGRRKSTVFNNDMKKEKENTNQFFKSLLVYGLLGFFIGLMLFFDINKMYLMSVYFSFLMFMVLSIFISDFSSVILDIRDKNIIYTRGVDDKTINAVKVTHILIYMIYLTIALTGVSLIISLRYGILFFIIFLFEIILIDILMISITALLYILILKVFDGEKLKDLINFIQIALSIVIVCIYQVIPRVFSIVDISNITYKEKIWHVFMPPMWFGALISIVSGEKITYFKIGFSILAISIPVLSILTYIKLVPIFEYNLQKLNNNEEKSKKKEKRIIKIYNKLCKDNTEKAFFNFTLGIIESEREFKLKAYPNIALGMIMPFIFMLIGFVNVDFKDYFNNLRNGNSYLTIYVFIFVIPNILILLRYSENYLAAWIYKIAPIENISSMFKGIFKAIIYKLILFPYMIISVIFIFIFGCKIILNLIIVFFTIILILSIMFCISKKTFPFSQKSEVVNSGESMILLFANIFIILSFLLFNYIAIKFRFGLYIYFTIIFIITIICWKNIFSINKDKLYK